jgi:hypothetical protein
MGILDDAIREHLELKRNHGATDSELQRMEDEAFGPPSRPGEPDFPEGGADAEHAGNGAVHEAPVGHEEPPAEAAEAEAQPADHDPGDHEVELPIDEGHPMDESQVEAEAVEEDRLEGDEQTALHDETAKPSEAPIESLDTVEHPMPEEEVEEERAEEPSQHEADEEDEGVEEDEDVLADTPEFLKDAPEDDELWFEQGKPKDFDF